MVPFDYLINSECVVLCRRLIHFRMWTLSFAMISSLGLILSAETAHSFAACFAARRRNRHTLLERHDMHRMCLADLIRLTRHSGHNG